MDELGQTALLQEAVNKTRSARICPGAVTCGERADNLVFDEACWNCETGRIKEDYQELFCEKSSLTSCGNGRGSCPTYVDLCASPEFAYRGAYCKKFGELSPPDFRQGCWYRGSEYKALYCDYFLATDTYVPMCAADTEVGEGFCSGFAHHFPTVGYIECHSRMTYMMHHCLEQQIHNRFDPPCAAHDDIGGEYCRTFARNVHSELLAECVKHDSYLTLFCDVKASQNETVQACASHPRTRGMYCQELALKKNGFADCWGVGQFANTYCAEISWNVQSCRLLGEQEAQAELESQQATW